MPPLKLPQLTGRRKSTGNSKELGKDSLILFWYGYCSFAYFQGNKGEQKANKTRRLYASALRKV